MIRFFVALQVAARLSAFKFNKGNDLDDNPADFDDESKKRPRFKEFPCDPMIKKVFFAADFMAWEGAEETTELYQKVCPGHTHTCCSEEEMLTFSEEYFKFEERLNSLRLIVERSMDYLYRVDVSQVARVYQEAASDKSKKCGLPPWARIESMHDEFVQSRDQIDSDLTHYFNEQGRYYSGLVCGFCSPAIKGAISKTGYTTKIVVTEAVCRQKFSEITTLEKVIKASFVLTMFAKAALCADGKPLNEYRRVHTLQSLDQALANLAFCADNSESSLKKKSRCYYDCYNLMKLNIQPVFNDLNFWMRKGFSVASAKFPPQKPERFKQLFIPGEFLLEKDGTPKDPKKVQDQLFEMRYEGIDSLPMSSTQEDFVVFPYNSKPYDFDVFELEIASDGFSPYETPIELEEARAIVMGAWSLGAGLVSLLLCISFW